MDGLGSTEYSSTSLMGPPDDLYNISTNTSVATATGLRFSIPKIVIIALFASLASIATVVGNVMVMISFKIDKQLQTISNYFLFSLAIAGVYRHSYIIIAHTFRFHYSTDFVSDEQLKTKKFLIVVDFAIGLISMPLFTVTTLLGYWPLGPYVCDTWLALDYLASNASVLNLLIISFDRYFSVTRPLTYRAKRTTNRGK